MIKIYKDDHEIIVSRNTYETMFKKLGYVEVKAKPVVVEEETEEVIKEVKNKKK